MLAFVFMEVSVLHLSIAVCTIVGVGNRKCLGRTYINVSMAYYCTLFQALLDVVPAVPWG